MALHRDAKAWQHQQGMKSDLSWDASARRYADLYRAVGG
jgi:glycogen synthase